MTETAVQLGVFFFVFVFAWTAGGFSVFYQSCSVTETAVQLNVFVFVFIVVFVVVFVFVCCVKAAV